MLAGQLKALRRVQLRLLITSRSEGYITKSFAQLAEYLYRSARLEKIRPPVEGDLTKDDITKYLSHMMTSIAKKHGVNEGDIPEITIDQLSKKSDGLFIYAATACRFLDANDFDIEEARQERLDLILESNSESDDSDSDDSEDNDWAHNAPQNKVDDIYRKVLSFPDRGMGPKTRKKTYASMRMVLGLLVVLFEPVANISLKELLPSEAEVMDKLLKNLRAIVNVPDDERLPLELIHLSFRDFILSRKRSRQLKFRVDESCMHLEVFKRCLHIMSSMLRQDICGLIWPGTIDSEIPQSSVESNIPQHLRYACRYWVDHLAELDYEKQRDVVLLENEAVYSFLQKSFLFWLEVMGLIKETAAAVIIINKLQLLVNNLENSVLSSLIYDMKRFVLSHRWIIDHAPLQIYSTLIFIPEESQTRSLFEPLMPSWVVQQPAVDMQWTTQLSALQGHTHEIKSVAFNPDHSHVVSLSCDDTIRVWDTVTGTERFRFDVGGEDYMCFAMSPDGRSIALGTGDGPIDVREFAKGTRFRLNGHWIGVKHLVYSPKTGSMLASAGLDNLIIWDIHKSHARHVLHTPGYDAPDTCQFTPDEQYLIAGGNYESITMWSAKGGHCVRTFDRFDTTHAQQLAISMDGSMASFGRSFLDHDFPDYARGRITLLSLSTGEKQVESSADEEFSLISMIPPDGKSVLVETIHNEICVLDATTGSLETQFQVPDTDYHFELSRDGKLLVSGGGDHIVRLWDMQLNGVWKQAPETKTRRFTRLQFSPVRSLILGYRAGYDTVQVYDSTGGRLSLFAESVGSIDFSPDERYIALRKDRESCQIWDKDMATPVSTPKQLKNVVFSPDGSYMAVLPTDGGTEILSATTFQEIMTWEKLEALDMRFSPDGKVFTLSYHDKELKQTVFEMWSMSLKRLIWQTSVEGTKGIEFPTSEVKFSPACWFTAFRWTRPRREEVMTWQIIDLAKGESKSARSCGNLVVFHPQDWLVALDHGRFIEIKETASWISKQKFRLANHPDGIDSMNFSKTGKFAAASGWYRYTRSKPTLQLWDITSGAEIGRYTVDGVISGLSFSDEGYLLCDQGRLPFPSVLPDEQEKDVKMEQMDAQDLLYVGSQWLYRGLERLMWLPAAFRSEVSILKGDSLALAHQNGDVRMIKCDLDKLPVRKYGSDRD